MIHPEQIASPSQEANNQSHPHSHLQPVQNPQLTKREYLRTVGGSRRTRGRSHTNTDTPPHKIKSTSGNFIHIIVPCTQRQRKSFMKFTEMQFSSNFKSKINFTAQNSSGISLLLLTVTHEHEIPRKCCNFLKYFSQSTLGSASHPNKSQYHFL